MGEGRVAKVNPVTNSPTIPNLPSPTHMPASTVCGQAGGLASQDSLKGMRPGLIGRSERKCADFGAGVFLLFFVASFTLVCTLCIKGRALDVVWHGADSFGNVCGVDNTMHSDTIEMIYGSGGQGSLSSTSDNVGLDLTLRPFLFYFNTSVGADGREPLRVCVPSCPSNAGTSSTAGVEGLCLGSAINGMNDENGILQIDADPGSGNAAPQSVYTFPPSLSAEALEELSCNAGGCPLKYLASEAVANRCQPYSSTLPVGGWWLWLLADVTLLQYELLAIATASVLLPMLISLLLVCSDVMFVWVAAIMPPVLLVASAVMLTLEAHDIVAETSLPEAGGNDVGIDGVVSAITVGLPTLAGTKAMYVAGCIGSYMFSAVTFAIGIVILQLRGKTNRFLKKVARILRRNIGVVVTPALFTIVFCGVIVAAAASVYIISSTEVLVAIQPLQLGADHSRVIGADETLNSPGTNALQSISPWFQCVGAIVCYFIVRAAIALHVSAVVTADYGERPRGECCVSKYRTCLLACQTIGCYCGAVFYASLETMLFFLPRIAFLCVGFILMHQDAFDEPSDLEYNGWYSWMLYRSKQYPIFSLNLVGAEGVSYGVGSKLLLKQVRAKFTIVGPVLRISELIALNLSIGSAAGAVLAASAYMRTAQPNVRCPAVLAIGCGAVAFFIALVALHAVRCTFEAVAFTFARGDVSADDSDADDNDLVITRKVANVTPQRNGTEMMATNPGLRLPCQPAPPKLGDRVPLGFETDFPAIPTNGSRGDLPKQRLAEPLRQVPVPSYWKNQDQTTASKMKLGLERSDESKATFMQTLLRGSNLLVTTGIYSAAAQPVRCKCSPDMNTIKVTKVERVENTLLWADYQHEMKRMEARHTELVPNKRIKPFGLLGETVIDQPLNARVNEVMLFHGTSPANAIMIAKSGFNERLSNPDHNCHGWGCYFADNACKSNQYCEADETTDSGEYTMMLCRVLLGEAHIAEEAMPGIRLPPEKPDQADGERYDSVIASGFQDHTEFIVYNGRKAYPEYIIYYKSAEAAAADAKAAEEAAAAKAVEEAAAAKAAEEAAAAKVAEEAAAVKAAEEAEAAKAAEEAAAATAAERSEFQVTDAGVNVLHYRKMYCLGCNALDCLRLAEFAPGADDAALSSIATPSIAASDNTGMHLSS